MSKRELEMLSSSVDVNAPRAKRRKDATTSREDKRDVQMVDVVAVKAEGNEESLEADTGNRDAVKEQGLQLWQVLKDAADKEGRSLSNDFLSLPSKRLYPDYYSIIKKPLALDQIRLQIKSGQYKSLADVRLDFEQCFRNAKRYNLKESQIWKDAKALHKLTLKEYGNMTGDLMKIGDDHDDEGGEEGAVQGGSGDEGGHKKKKPPNMNRLLTTRLEKLVAKTNAAGNVLSSEFMELPQKKLWPIYYKTIARPMSFEKIFKHLKRKEYHTSAEFAADVELVFSNALQFNEDHTPVWEAAQALRKHFHKLMSDLPAPFSLSQYTATKESTAPSNKIKLKVPPVNHASTSIAPQAPKPSSAPSPAAGSSSPLVLKVPLGNAAHTSTAMPTPAGVTPSVTAQSSPYVPAPSAPSPVPAPVATAGQSTLPLPQSQFPVQTQASTLSNFTHYPQTAFQAPSAPSAPTPSVVLHSSITPHSMSNSPVPLGPIHPLKSVLLTIKPVGRRLELDCRDGVKSWALRLVPGEMGVKITDASYLGDEEEESSSDEQEDEEEVDDSESGIAGKGKGKGKAKQGRARQVGAVRIKDGVKLPPKRVPPHLQVKLDASVIRATETNEDEWDVELGVGSHLLEMGEKGGAVWKVHIERMAG